MATSVVTPRNAHTDLPAPRRERQALYSLIPSPLQEKISILLVDDNPAKMVALEAVLSDLGQNVVKASSGRQALKLLLQQEFGVILLDVRMPGMDGFETASLIRRRPACALTPIIFVTSLSTSETEIAQGYSLGAVDYVLSPIIPNVLRAKVSVFVELARKTALIQQQAEEMRRIQDLTWQRTLDETNKQLKRESLRNRFFTHSIEMLAIAKPDGSLLEANSHWLSALGHLESELTSLNFLDLIHSEDRPEITQQIEDITAGKISGRYEHRFRCRSGSYKWLAWTIAFFAEENVFYLFARDVSGRRERESQIRRLNEDLRRRTAELQTANGDLESFSYSVSHDLRTPLRSIAGFSQILLMDHLGGLDEEGRQMLQSISRNAVYMSQLIDDVLDFCRLGLMSLSVSSIDIRHLAESAIELLKPSIGERKINVEIGDLPAAQGDPSMVRQLMFNLLSNAIKFTAPRPRASIVIGHQEQEGGIVYFIRDNGIGFDMKYYDKLFGVFQRLPSGTGFDGTGVGLAIVHKIVQRHGGRVWAEGKPDQGATFYFTLPAQV